MKIARFNGGRIAAVKDGEVIDLALAYAAFLESQSSPKPSILAPALLPSDLGEFIQGGEQSVEAARIAEEYASERTGGVDSEGKRIVFDISQVTLQAPLPGLASTIICMGRNFRDHVQSMDASGRAVAGMRGIPKRPSGFFKLASTVVGPDAAIAYPSKTRKLDYEAEVAVIIGRSGKDIQSRHAMEHVFGYSVFNDWSARDQPDFEDMNFVFSQKNWDTSASMGPWIVTADEISDPHSLSLRCRVNGELRQDGNTSDMMRKFPEIIEFFSRDRTVHPGDIFTSGTPSGTGAERSDDSWFLKPGDAVEAEVEGIGVLKNHIVSKDG